MQRLVVQRLSQTVLVSIESQARAMNIELTPDEAAKVAVRLMEAANATPDTSRDRRQGPSR